MRQGEHGSHIPVDEHVGDGRLRGSWTSSDGAAGRMTATAGLHNMPADLRPSIVAEDGFLFVRSDLGQIEPRVLASVSGDKASSQHRVRSSNTWPPLNC